MSMDDDEQRDLALLLADPSLWLEPGPAVEADVLDAIRAERRASTAAAAGPATSAVVVPIDARRRAWTTHLVAGLVGAAAAALIAVVVVRTSDDGAQSSSAPDSSFQLLGTDLAPGFEGTSELIEALQQHVRGRLAPYEYPKEIEFIEALPMTTTGKVQRRVLRLIEEEKARVRD